MVNLDKANKRMKFYSIADTVMSVFAVVFLVLAFLHPDKVAECLQTTFAALIASLCLKDSQRQIKDAVTNDILSGLYSRIRDLEKQLEEKKSEEKE